VYFLGTLVVVWWSTACIWKRIFKRLQHWNACLGIAKRYEFAKCCRPKMFSDSDRCRVIWGKRERACNNNATSRQSYNTCLRFVRSWFMAVCS